MRPFIYVREGLEPPDGQDFFIPELAPERKPFFTVRQVGSIFFARGRTWMWFQIKNGNHQLEDVEWHVPVINANGQTQYQLHHVEKMAHGFISCGTISMKTFENSLTIIQAMARNYRIIP